MGRARRMRWWLAVPVGVAVGLALAVALDRAAAPASAQGSGAGLTLSVEQLRINQRIAQQGVKRANRANDGLDALRTGVPAAVGPQGPAGPVGPAGPAGPGAARISYSAAVGASAQTILELAGVTISVTCDAGGGGETALAITAGTEQATTLFVSSVTDTGTDPSIPGPAEVSSFQAALPAAQDTLLGGPSAPDGEFARSVSSVLFVTPTRTLSLHVAVVADSVADRCSFDGVAVPS